MAKQIAFDAQAKEALKTGVEKLARAVKVTMGPRGRNAMIDKSWGGPTVTKDGVTVAEEIELIDPNENMAAQLVKEAASKTSDVAGDGTTTATVLTEAIFLEGYKNITAGADPVAINRGIRKGVEAITADLKKQSRKVKDKSDIMQVAAIAANNDTEIGRMIANAMEKVGKDGVITVEEGKGLETEITIVEGMNFDRGYLSGQFVTNPDKRIVELENPLILIYEEKISSLKDLVPLLEKVVKAAQPLLIIAEDVEGEALATLVVNKLRGTLKVAAVKAPGFGDRRKAMLDDIAVLTGGRGVFKDLGIQLDALECKDLGGAKKVIIDADSTTIVGGKGKASALQNRISQIRQEIEKTTSDYDSEKLQERLAKLAGGVAEINVGAASEIELKERKARVEDALHATRAAVEEGIVTGGGVALIRASASTNKLKLTEDEAVGLAVLQGALSKPLWQIAENAGAEAGVVVKKVSQAKGDNGFNALTGTYENLLQAGIMDPTKVTRTAVENAASVASLLLTADALVSDVPQDDADGGAPGMPDMGGMGGGMPGMGGGMPGMGGMGGGMPGMGGMGGMM